MGDDDDDDDDVDAQPLFFFFIFCIPAQCRKLKTTPEHLIDTARARE